MCAAGAPGQPTTEGLLKGGDLLKKEGPLAADLIPGWQAWGPLSGARGCEDTIWKVALCPQTPSA